MVWNVLESTGSLSLGQSATEYSVYDSEMIYGRWPANADGYRFARETYEAHKQSPAHGIAYSATGYQDPARIGLPTTPVIKSQTYASPMSYVGSTRRILAWAKAAAKRSAAFAVFVWIAAVIAMLFMWTFLLFWYFVVFFLFGIFTFPYRLIRRGQRKTLHVQQTTLATQQAMYQQMMADHQQQQKVPPPAGAVESTPLPKPPDTRSLG